MDLNLLASLDVLIEEANVTRAAARLGLSQPALSAQLGRLRDLLGDPLLIPADSGRGMVATPRALALRDPLRAALKDLAVAVTKQPDFDPARDARCFIIGASDLATMTIGLTLVEQMQSNPGHRIQFSFRNLPTAQNAAIALERGDVDLVISAGQTLPGALKMRKLAQDRHFMIQRKGHPRGIGPLDLAAYCALDHVIVSPVDGSLRGPVDDLIEALGHKRHVALAVQQFSLALLVVERTDLVAALPERFARHFLDRIDVTALPFDTPDFGLFAVWHPRSQLDSGHHWLRSRLADVANPMERP